MHKLGLLPLVKELRIYRNSFTDSITPKRFNSRILRQFGGFTNVRDLDIEYLDIPSFMPGIRRYFNHFLPTVQSLTLAWPKASSRQITYFVGLFEHLEDFMLHGCSLLEETEDDLGLVPLFTPPLKGRLEAWYLEEMSLFKVMIDLFGGLRFCEMNIFDVPETRLLLSACSETLLTIQLHPTDPHGEQPCVKCM
jgi:hypothetical protein